MFHFLSLKRLKTQNVYESNSRILYNVHSAVIPDAIMSLYILKIYTKLIYVI